METVSITELRHHIANWVDRAQAGEEVVIVRGGAPVARIVPYVDRRAEAEQRLSAVRASSVVGDLVAPVGEDDWESAP